MEVSPGLCHLDGVVLEVREVQVAQEGPAVGVGVGAHAPVARRGEGGQLRPQAALLVEQLLGPVAAHPGLELLQVLRVGAGGRERNLVGTPRALDRQPVDLRRAGPALGAAQDDHRPRPAPTGTAVPGLALDVGDLVEGRVEGGRHGLVHGLGLVALDEVGPMAVALHEPAELVVADAGQHGGVGDLPAVEVQDRQDGPVVDRVQELVGVPAGGQRAGLGLAVADDARHHEVGVVQGGAVGVGQGVAQLTPLVDRSGRLGRGVAGDAARERELLEQRLDPLGIGADVRVELAVAALEPGVGHHAGAAVARPADVDDVEVALADHPVEVDVEEVEPRGRAPVAEQAGLDVLRLQFLPQEGVVQQVDLAHREVVGGPPVGVDAGERFGREHGRGDRRRHVLLLIVRPPQP